MEDIRFSVIIPAFRQAEYVADAIQSVLDQSYQHFEIIVVNDYSPDHTREVVNTFQDPRIQYIEHEVNQGLPAARNTGINASSGDFIALLDADDYFHPKKLELHNRYIKANPSLGVSYNGRFALNYSKKTIREVVNVPGLTGISNFVLGFPFTPSDMVIHREWLYKVGLFDASLIHMSEDLDIYCRLALEGCVFGGIDRALNYRRYHSGRTLNINARLNAALGVLDKIFADPRMPAETKSLQGEAYKNHYLVWAFEAFKQDQMELGQVLIQKAVNLVPTILEGEISELTRYLMVKSVHDEHLDHRALLEKIFAQLPSEISPQQKEWAIGQGYIMKGISTLVWGQSIEGEDSFAKAQERKVNIDEKTTGYLAHQLIHYEKEYGPEQTREIFKKLAPQMEKIGGKPALRHLKGIISYYQVFKNYRLQNYRAVPSQTIQAMINNPGYIMNRGFWSIILRSLIRATIPSTVFSK